MQENIFSAKQNLEVVQFHAMLNTQEDNVVQKKKQLIITNNLRNFLSILKLTESDLLEGEILIEKLECLMDIGFYGNFIKFFVSEHLFFKCLVYPLLSTVDIKFREIKQPHYISDLETPLLAFIKNESITYASSEKKATTTILPKKIEFNKRSCLCRYFKMRMWLKNRSTLLFSSGSLRISYATEGFAQVTKTASKVWSLLLLSIIFADTLYPNDYNNFASNFFSISEYSEILGRGLYSDKIWSAVFFLPLSIASILALANALNIKSIPGKSILLIKEYWINYKPSFWRDGIRPIFSNTFPSFVGTCPCFINILPKFILKSIKFSIFPNPRYNLKNVRRTLLWDGRVKSKYRLQLFESLICLLQNTAYLTRIEILGLLANIAENIHPKNIIQLYQEGMDRDNIKAILFMQTQALENLMQYAKKSYGLSAFAAHFLLWKIGKPKSKLLQPIFYLWHAYFWYSTISFLKTVGKGIGYAINLNQQRSACEDSGKLFLYMEQVLDYRCSICGDLPISYKNMFDDQKCTDAFLSVRLTAIEILQFIKGEKGRVNFEKVKRLDLANQALDGEGFSKIIYELSDHIQNSIEDLSLASPIFFYSFEKFPHADNSIGDEGAKALGFWLSSGSQLKILQLWGNNITSEGFQHIVSGFNMSNLTQLEMGNNYIGDTGVVSLMSELKETCIEMLGLGFNHIGIEGCSALAVGLKGNKYLTFLDISNNNINAKSMELFAMVLPQTHLRTLVLWGNSFGDEGLEALAAQLPMSSYIENLFLGQTNISATGMKIFSEKLPKSNLIVLNLYGNKLGDEAVKTLALKIPKTSLLNLVLGNNSITFEGAKELAENIKKSSLERLYLGENCLGAKGAKEIASQLLGSNLWRLNLWNNNIGNEGAKWLADGIKGSGLKELRLAGNSIEDEGIAALAHVLSETNLTVLDLNRNNFSSNGLQLLALNLPKTTIKKLYLSGNGINKISAQSLTEIITNSSVIELYLNDNNLGDKGVKTIAKNLQKSCITTLELRENGISNIGVSYFIEAMVIYPDSHSHYIWFHEIDSKFSTIPIAPKPNSQLSRLTLGYNFIDDKGMAALCRILPYTNISLYDLDLTGNIGSNPNLQHCNIIFTSSASRLELPLPFRLLGHVYQTIKERFWSRNSQQPQQIIFKPISEESDDVVDIQTVADLVDDEFKIPDAPFLFEATNFSHSDSRVALLSSSLLDHRSDIIEPNAVLIIFFAVMLLWGLKKIFNFGDRKQAYLYCIASGNRHGFWSTKNSDIDQALENSSEASTGAFPKSRSFT